MSTAKIPRKDVISRHVVPWIELAWPMDWDAVFRRAAPLVVEIGFGNGSFLLDLARNRPDDNILGIELSWSPIRHLLRKLERRDLPNLMIVKADANVALRHFFSSGVIAEVFINFPDPWPKDRHHARRLIQSMFLRRLAARMQPGAALTIATDHADYAEWIEAVLRGQSLFTSRHPSPRVHHIAGRPVTKYERKARELGLTIHYFQWQKTGVDASPPPVETLGIHTMPNVTFKGRVDLAAVFRNLEPKTLTWKDDDHVVVVNQVGIWERRDETPSWIIETVVKDGPLTQHVAILVTRTPPDLITV